MLDNKKIVLTGGCGLIGQTFVDAILQKNGTVIIVDKDHVAGEKLLHILQKEYPNRVFFYSLDITSKASIQELLSQHKSIDALVNNAYPRNKNYGKKLEEVFYDDFCENMNMHLGGYFLCMQQFAEYFKKQGHGNIVSMSSIYGVVAPRFDIYQNTEITMPVEYAAIKSSIIHLTKYFAKYYKGANIRFNCISPGGVLNNHSKVFQNSYAQYAINKGMIDPQDLKGSLLFLLSEDSHFVNGQNIIVDDGWSL